MKRKKNRRNPIQRNERFIIIVPEMWDDDDKGEITDCDQIDDSDDFEIDDFVDSEIDDFADSNEMDDFGDF